MNTDNQTGREMTYGEKAVGLTLNPSGDPKVQEIKELYAKIIDICVQQTTPDRNSEGTEWCYEAIRQAQTAQMWAVKAITYKF